MVRTSPGPVVLEAGGEEIVPGAIGEFAANVAGDVITAEHQVGDVAIGADLVGLDGRFDRLEAGAGDPQEFEGGRRRQVAEAGFCGIGETKCAAVCEGHGLSFLYQPTRSELVGNREAEEVKGAAIVRAEGNGRGRCL